MSDVDPTSIIVFVYAILSHSTLEYNLNMCTDVSNVAKWLADTIWNFIITEPFLGGNRN